MSTTVGYTGGSTAMPTYRAMSDHTESIRIVYDPERISYADLLAVFWASHSPTYEPFSVQYRSAIFPHDAEQKQIAAQSLANRQAKLGKTLHTAIEDASAFWPAEDYHQKYRLRHDDVLMAELKARYPSEAALMKSTTAARLNGLLGGNGRVEQLDALDLAGRTRERLRAQVVKR